MPSSAAAVYGILTALASACCRRAEAAFCWSCGPSSAALKSTSSTTLQSAHLADESRPGGRVQVLVVQAHLPAHRLRGLDRGVAGDGGAEGRLAGGDDDHLLAGDRLAKRGVGLPLGAREVLVDLGLGRGHAP